MTDTLPQWALDRAEVWLRGSHLLDDPADVASLAALLVEVQSTSERGWIEMQQLSRVSLLAEVRRVVKEISKRHDGADSWCYVEDEILSRLDKL